MLNAYLETLHTLEDFTIVLVSKQKSRSERSSQKKVLTAHSSCATGMPHHHHWRLR